MTDFTDAHRQAALAAVAQALAVDAPHVEGAPIAPEGISDVKQLFCDNWGVVKQVLQVLGNLVPGLGLIIGIIIKAGDAAHGAICPG
ncbi:hypothetical protein [Sphingomonas sp. KR3-1]|uniref:hypothetical protein n=1 Tax=Sphingomonas sp. KR3-1 TaxID=3156611 RepID=UPI0032B5A340